MQSAIYSGQVSHSRKEPLRHSFRYRVTMMYLDLGELEGHDPSGWNLARDARPSVYSG